MSPAAQGILSADSLECRPDTRISVDENAFYYLGWQDGYTAGVGTTEASYQLWLGVHKPVLSLPAQTDLATSRTVDNLPCAQVRNSRGKRRAKDCPCSRCTRYLQAWRNMQTYGSVDFPGVAA